MIVRKVYIGIVKSDTPAMCADYRQRFLATYSRLPLGLRNEIILVLDTKEHKGPITWQVAYLEIQGKTKLGAIILKKLVDMEII